MCEREKGGEGEGSAAVSLCCVIYYAHTHTQTSHCSKRALLLKLALKNHTIYKCLGSNNNRNTYNASSGSSSSNNNKGNKLTMQRLLYVCVCICILTSWRTRRIGRTRRKIILLTMRRRKHGCLHTSLLAPRSPLFHLCRSLKFMPCKIMHAGNSFFFALPLCLLIGSAKLSLCTLRAPC